MFLAMVHIVVSNVSCCGTCCGKLCFLLWYMLWKVLLFIYLLSFIVVSSQLFVVLSFFKFSLMVVKEVKKILVFCPYWDCLIVGFDPTNVQLLGFTVSRSLCNAIGSYVRAHVLWFWVNWCSAQQAGYMSPAARPGWLKFTSILPCCQLHFS